LDSDRSIPSPVRFLHSIGHAAQDDRSGAEIFCQSVRRLHDACRVTVRCQDRRMNVPFKSKGPHVELDVRIGGVDNHWDQYRGQDVLVLPRRYGGLSLPSQEAMAAGLALVMTACSPNEVWPGPKVPVREVRRVRMRCGWVEVCDADPVALADVMARLARNPDEVSHWQAESLAWADRNSWEALRPLWLQELRRACSSPGGQVARTVNGRTPGSVNV
jgi:glycosyltransferase involved in cell wall biosynthesis